jgi:Alpha/beta hydrolase family
MHKRLAVIAAALLLCLACSHTSTDQLRMTGQPIPPLQLEQLESRQDVPNASGAMECSDQALRSTSIEEFRNAKGGLFTVGVIELSDDGHVKDEEQRAMVFQRLRQVAAGWRDHDKLLWNGGATPQITRDSEGVTLVVFVHGWHHRPKVCDNNMACFRRVLRALSTEHEMNGLPPVFGVYIGWRGDSLHPPFDPFTFWDRKSTAHRIGDHGGRELLVDLAGIYDELNAQFNANTGRRDRVMMVTVGHSFGGALVYSAVEGAMLKEIKGRHVVGANAVNGRLPIRPGFGDLVILVNPAFEASRYDTFDRDRMLGRYSDAQLPVLLTVASQADDAVGKAFPGGRSLYFLGHPFAYNGRTDLIGLGHWEAQVTHTLTLTNPQDAPPLKINDPQNASPADRERCHLEAHDLANCACDYAFPDESLRTAHVAGEFAKYGAGTVPLNAQSSVVLTAKDPKQARLPFTVVRASGDVINGHNDIYNPRFLAFLVAYIDDFLQVKQARESRLLAMR